MPSRRPLVALLVTAIGALLATPGPAGAVVGGEPLKAAAAPWFADTGLCGGTLIAPDRVVTAAHCLDPIDLTLLERIRIGGEVRRGTRVALPPTWRVQRAGFALDDIAIVQLDRPVTGVRPAALPAAGARTPKRVRILGEGQTKAPRPGKPSVSGKYGFHGAALRTIGDADCARRFRRSATRYRARFDAASAFCAIDVNGRAPLSNVCAGDSGGPLIAGTLARPVLLGVISWTGPRCGADRLPSVVNDVRHYLAFLTDPEPDWAPVPSGPVRVTGEPRAGATLTCEPPAWEVAPAGLRFRWLRRMRGRTAYEFTLIGGSATYVPVAADRGLQVECQMLGEGPGGRSQTPHGETAVVRVAS